MPGAAAEQCRALGPWQLPRVHREPSPVGKGTELLRAHVFHVLLKQWETSPIKPSENCTTGWEIEMKSEPLGFCTITVKIRHTGLSTGHLRILQISIQGEVCHTYSNVNELKKH